MSFPFLFMFQFLFSPFLNLVSMPYYYYVIPLYPSKIIFPLLISYSFFLSCNIFILFPSLLVFVLLLLILLLLLGYFCWWFFFLYGLLCFVLSAPVQQYTRCGGGYESQSISQRAEFTNEKVKNQSLITIEPT